MDTAVASRARSRVRAVMVLVLLFGAVVYAAVPARANQQAQEPDPPVGAAQAGTRAFVPIVQDVPGGKPNATAWLRLSAPRINPGSFFSLTVLTKSTGTAPEPFVNVFVSYDTSRVDFQSANTVPGDFVSTNTNGFTVSFRGPLRPGEERYATIVFRARAGVENADVRFAGSYEAASNASGGLPIVTLLIGGGEIHPSVRFACEFGRGGSGPLGQNPSSGNYPFGTRFTFGAFRRNNGGCGYTFSPNARVAYWVAQPTGPSVPTNIYSTADIYGEVEIRYTTFQLQSACPVNLCAFAMNASSDNSYVLVAPFNLTRPPLAGGSEQSAAATAVHSQGVAETLAGPAGAASVTPQQLGGTISGRLTAEGGAPLREVPVWVYDATLSQVVSVAITDANGNYTSAALPDGGYVVQFDAAASAYDPSIGYTGEYHNDQPLGTPPTPVTVSAQAPATNVNGTLARCATCGAIEGRVTAQDGGGPLADVTIVVRNAANGQQVAFDTTDESGNYHLLVPTGSYTVEAFTDVSPLAQVRAYLDGPATPAAIQVTAPAVVGNVNKVLARGGQIGGRVTASDGGAGLPDVVVSVLGPNDTLLTTTITEADGSFTTPALANGSYRVQFQADLSPNATTREYAPATRTVTVSGPGARSNTNVTLAR